MKLLVQDSSSRLMSSARCKVEREELDASTDETMWLSVESFMSISKNIHDKGAMKSTWIEYNHSNERTVQLANHLCRSKHYVRNVCRLIEVHQHRLDSLEHLTIPITFSSHRLRLKAGEHFCRLDSNQNVHTRVCKLLGSDVQARDILVCEYNEMAIGTNRSRVTISEVEPLEKNRQRNGQSNPQPIVTVSHSDQR